MIFTDNSEATCSCARDQRYPAEGPVLVRCSVNKCHMVSRCVMLQVIFENTIAMQHRESIHTGTVEEFYFPQLLREKVLKCEILLNYKVLIFIPVSLSYVSSSISYTMTLDSICLWKGEITKLF